MFIYQLKHERMNFVHIYSIEQQTYVRAAYIYFAYFGIHMTVDDKFELVDIEVEAYRAMKLGHFEQRTYHFI